MNKIPTDPDQVPEEFNEWREENNYSYYDSFERMIHMPSRQLHSFVSVYELFLIDTGREQTNFQKRLVEKCFS